MGVMNEATATQAARVMVDPRAVQQLGTRLISKFQTYENDRRLTELKWARNARQRLGIYDPDIESQLTKDRSRAYPKLTRVKCVSMLSRLMNLLFQAGDKPWTVEPSPVPNIGAADLALLLKTIDQKAQAEQREPSDDEIETAIRKLAVDRAARLELEIEDQLRELGGNRSFDYVALCRKVLQSGIDYGVGILKGPFAMDQKQRRWKRDPTTKLLVPDNFTAKRPRFEFIPVWDYYPDMAAKTFRQMDGQFTRNVMSRQQVLQLKTRRDFLAPQIDEALRIYANGNYRQRAFETEVRSMGSQINVTQTERGKYEVLVWDGNATGADLHAAGANVSPAQLNSDVRASIWFIGDIVIKAELEPWSVLAADDPPPLFHHFIFEEDESTLLGIGLPNIMRDSQMNLCATIRMELDNASIACGLNLEVNVALMSTNQDITQNQPNKIWYRDDDNPATLQYPAVREIKIDSRITELKMLGEQFLAFADQETFVGPATGGAKSKGPSAPFRTATGASLLRGDAALPFKDVVRNFDVFTQSVIGSLLTFNKIFNQNPMVQGDFQPIARGATSLIAKEVLGMQLDNLAQTLTDEEKMYIDFRKLARERVRVRDLDQQDIVVDDAEADRREKAENDKRSQLDQQNQRMAEAEIRKLLSGVLKDLSQAGKNAAAAEATSANVVLDALEKGLSPHALAHEVAGTGTSGGAAAAAPGAGVQADAGAGAAAPAGDQGSAGGMPPGSALPAPGGGEGAGLPPPAA